MARLNLAQRPCRRPCFFVAVVGRQVDIIASFFLRRCCIASLNLGQRLIALKAALARGSAIWLPLLAAARLFVTELALHGMTLKFVRLHMTCTWLLLSHQHKNLF